MAGRCNNKICRNWKTAHRRAKWRTIWTLGLYVACMLIFFTLHMSRSFGVICGVPFWKLGRNSTAHRPTHVEQQTDKNLGLGGICSMHVDIFDLEHVKFIWSHSVHFSKKNGSTWCTGNCYMRRHVLLCLFLQGEDLIREQVQRLVSLPIWCNLLPVSHPRHLDQIKNSRLWRKLQ